MKLAQLRDVKGTYKYVMLAEDWEAYKKSDFSKEMQLCEYTKTGRIKKNSKYLNRGVEFVKYIDLNELHVEKEGFDSLSAKIEDLLKIHDKIKEGNIFNFQSNNWLPRGFTWKEQRVNEKIGKQMYKDLMKDFNPEKLGRASQSIIENMCKTERDLYKEIIG